MSIQVKEEPTTDFLLELVPVEEPASVISQPISEPVPFCDLCIRECPANVECFEFNSDNSSEFRHSLRELLGLEVHQNCFNICKTCWKMVCLIGDFREGCRTAQSWMERAESVGLPLVDDWNSEEMSHTIDFLQEAILDHTKRIELIEPAKDEIVTTVSNGQIELRAYEAEEVVSRELLLAGYSDDEHGTTAAEPLLQEVSQNLKDKGAENYTFFCKICDVSFSRRAHLEVHRQTSKHKKLVKKSGNFGNAAVHNNMVPDRAKLQRSADGRFTSAKRPDTNTEKVKENNFKCEKCDLSFSRKNYLKYHRQTMKHKLKEGIKDLISKPNLISKHKCPLCGALMASKTSLNVHLKVKHREAEFKCDQCNTMYKTKYSLHRHIRRQHADLRNFYRPVCPMCLVEMASHSMLQVHLRQVHGEKDFQCDFCDEMFRAKYNMKRHIFRQHVNTCNFTCPVCNLRFREASSLASHQKKFHHGFECDECEEVFIRKKKLDLHKLLDHGKILP